MLMEFLYVFSPIQIFRCEKFMEGPEGVLGHVCGPRQRPKTRRDDDTAHFGARMGSLDPQVFPSGAERDQAGQWQMPRIHWGDKV